MGARAPFMCGTVITPAPEGLTVRPAAAQDQAGVLALWALLDRLHAELWPTLFRAAARRLRHAAIWPPRSPDRALLVAEYAGELAGVVSVFVSEAPADPVIQPGCRAYVEDLVVGPQHRRAGVGRALIDAASAFAKERGAGEVLLTVWEGNRAAVDFYRDLGFSPRAAVLGRKL